MARIYLTGSGNSRGYHTGSGILSLPVRVQIRELDNKTGSYPTILRTGDSDFTGVYKTFYDDTNTINFVVQNAVYPTNLPSNSKFVSGGIATPNKLQGLVAIATSTAGIADSHVSFTPGQNVSAFNDSKIFIDNNSNFYTTGTLQNLNSGFSQKLSSKHIVQINCDNVGTSEVYFSTGTVHDNTAGSHSGIAYFDWSSNAWINVARSITTGSSVDYLNPRYSIASNSYLSISPAVRTYAVTIGNQSSGSANQKGYGLPISTFGFPSSDKFNPQQNQKLSISSSINQNFLVEKISFEFSGTLSGPAFSQVTPTSTGSITDPVVQTFMLIRQRSNTPQRKVYFNGKYLNEADANIYSAINEYTNNNHREIVWFGRAGLYNGEQFSSESDFAAKYPEIYACADLWKKSSSAISGYVTGTFRIEAPCRVIKNAQFISPLIKGRASIVGRGPGYVVGNDFGGTSLSDLVSPKSFIASSIGNEISSSYSYASQEVISIAATATINCRSNTASNYDANAGDPAVGGEVILIDYSGTQVTYRFDISTGVNIAVPGTPKVLRIGVDPVSLGILYPALTISQAIAQQLTDGINSSDGHGGTIIASRNSSSVNLTQGRTGSSGNTTITRNNLIDSTLTYTGFSGGVDTSKPTITVNSYTTLTQDSPFLISPSDEFILCVAHQIATDKYDSTSYGEAKVATRDKLLITGQSKLTLFGTLLQDNKPVPYITNQPLTSPAIHESLQSNNQVLDQFDIDPSSFLSGSYVDNIITGSMVGTTFDRNFKFSTFAVGPNDVNVRKLQQSAFSNGGTTGSLQRFIGLTTDKDDSGGRFYDSLVPEISEFLSILGKGYATTGGEVFLFPGVRSGAAPTGDLTIKNWYFLYPFTTNVNRIKSLRNLGLYARPTYDPITGLSTGRTEDLTFRTKIKVDASGFGYGGVSSQDSSESLKLIWGIGDGEDNSPGFDSRNSILYAKSLRGFKYGLLNTEPQRTKCYFRRDRYGQFRDMLEQRLFSAMVPDNDSGQNFYPVTIKFYSRPNRDGSGFNITTPAQTHSQNLSNFATSSLPYFDGVARERSDNPDDTTSISLV